MSNIPIFVVNLKKDIEKKKHIEKLALKYNLKIDFIDAVYGKELSDAQIQKVYDRNRTLKEIGRDLSVGEIGCALSHMQIYQKILQENIEYAIILEDDVIFDNGLKKVSNSIKNFPKDWECVLLCYYRIDAFTRQYCLSFWNRKKIDQKYKIVRFVELMHSTAGYMINASGAKRLLDDLEKGIYKPIDHYTGDEKHINLYGLQPRPVLVDEVYGRQSSIVADRLKAENINIKQGEDKLRCFLKHIGLFATFKKLNMFRQKKQVPLVQLFYYLINLKKCLRLPKKYIKIN